MSRAILLVTVVTAAAVCAPVQPSPPARILIAYHSATGQTEKLAEAIRAGAASVPGVEVTLQKTADVKPADIPRYHGIVAGSPVHWANTSTEMRRFLDSVGAALWAAKTNGDGRTAGAFCTGGGTAMGKDTARWSILSAFLTMRFTIVGGVDAAGFGTLGPEATTGPADPGLSETEIKEAREFGRRFASATLRLQRAPAGDPNQ